MGLSIAAGGSETVSIAQRKAGDPIVPTYDVYDASGNLTDVYQPPVVDADPSSSTYNQTVNPHAHYIYDAYGDEIEQVTAREEAAFQSWVNSGNNPLAFTGGTAFGYDSSGDMVSRKLPDGETESTTFNQNGQEATHTDFNGNVATYTYLPATDPEAGSLSQVAYAAAPGSGKSNETVSYTYTNLGQQLAVDDNGATTTDSYDAEGDLTQVAGPEGTINYGYDLATGEHTSTTTSNTAIAYGYDNQGRLLTTTVSKLNGTMLTTPLVTTDAYDNVGNKTSETLPDGEVTTYTYDDLNRLTGVLEKQGTTTLFSQTYILNHDGTRASATESQRQQNGATTSIGTNWTYDADDRLTGESVNSSVTANSFTDAYAYDLAGNRITGIHTGPADGATGTATSTYNGDDELTKQVSTVNGETDFTYDANGSQLTSTNGSNTTTYTYDVRNKMVKVVGANGTTTYVYDDAGNRVSETVNGVTTTYLTDTTNPAGYAQPLEATTGSSRETYLIGDHVFAQVDGSGNVSYLLTDGHGSTRTITNASGAVTSTFSYDAFGGAIGFTAGSAGTIFLSGGDAIFDPASGLYLDGNGTRGRLGYRFIEADSLGYSDNADPITLHKYLYAGANPVSNIDPSGHDFDLADLLTDAGIESGLQSLAAPVLSKATQALGSALVSFAPTSLLDNAKPSAWILGIGLSADFTIPDLPIGGTANLTYDRVASLSGGGVANYVDLNGQFSTPRTSGSFGVPFTLGLAWGLQDSGQYAAWSFGASLPFKALPDSVKSKVWAGLSNVIADFPELIGPDGLSFPGGPDFSKSFGDDLAGEVAAASSKVLSLLDRLEATVFTDAGRDYFGVDLTFNANFGQSAQDDGTTYGSGNLGYSWQVYPSGSVTF